MRKGLFEPAASLQLEPVFGKPMQEPSFRLTFPPRNWAGLPPLMGNTALKRENVPMSSVAMYQQSQASGRLQTDVLLR